MPTFSWPPIEELRRQDRSTNTPLDPADKGTSTAARTSESAAGISDSAVIHDTGSTEDTFMVASQALRKLRIPYVDDKAARPEGLFVHAGAYREVA